MVVQKWKPDELKEKPEVTAIPLWVHLKNVPMNMYSWRGLSFITSAVGVPDRLHPETAACKNFKIAKIFVNADLTNELPSKINFTKDGKTSPVEFSYPWLPPRCNACGKWGHLEKVCVINKKDGSEKSIQLIIKEGRTETDNLVGKSDEKDGEKVVFKEGLPVEEGKHDKQSVVVFEEVEEGELRESCARKW